MLKWLVGSGRAIMQAWFMLINFCIFKLYRVQYLQFPDISGVIVCRGKGKLVFGAKVKVNSSIRSNPVGLTHRTYFYVSPSGIIAIGNNVGISNSLLFSINSITICDYVIIGGGCQIFDNDFHSIQYEYRILHEDSNIRSAPIVIKTGAFIGASSIILKGVTIGERSVIAAGSVVTKSVPSDQIWGGNPAKFLKNLNE